MAKFLLTFERITPESAAEGDVAERGVLAEGVSLREAFEHLWYAERGVEANEFPVDCPRWLTGYETHRCFDTGATANVSLHFPESVTAASRRRIYRLLTA